MIAITEEVKKKLRNNGFKVESEYEELLKDFVPTQAHFYHSTPTPEKFRDTHLLQESARRKKMKGHYCNAPYGSKDYITFWKEEKRRCLEGYTINKGNVNETSITGYHYFFLNYYKVEMIEENVIGRVWTFPKFLSTQYHFFWAFQESIGKEHLVLLKPRGIGFSEMLAAISCCNYTFREKENNYMYASSDTHLSKKDGALFTKIERELGFLNDETEDAFGQPILTSAGLNRIAGYKKKNNDSVYTGGSIVGKIIKKPETAKGKRSLLIVFEEAGSFKHLESAYIIAQPSVQDKASKVVFGSIIVGGTAGNTNDESGEDGLEGLRNFMFNPRAYGFKRFKNYWDKEFYGKDCGLFFPTYATPVGAKGGGALMDADGNVNELDIYLDIIKERIKLRTLGATDDNYFLEIAEHPITISEALIKKKTSVMPVFLADEQLRYVISENLDKLWVNGRLIKTKVGVKFSPDSSLKSYNEYPVNFNDRNIDGCISVLQPPIFLNEKIPRGLYTLGMDNFSMDEATYTSSIGSTYVYKNSMPNIVRDDEYTNSFVACYNGRPNSIQKYAENALMLTEFYNSDVNFEIRGGGQSIKDFAKMWKIEHLLAKSLRIFDSSDGRSNRRPYGNTFSKEQNIKYMTYISEWLQQVVGWDDVKEKEILRIHRIYDIGLLKEIYNFAFGGNFDRLSAIKNIMAAIQQQEIDTYGQPIDEIIYNFDAAMESIDTILL